MRFKYYIFLKKDRNELVPCGAMAAHWTSNPGVASSSLARGNCICRKVQLDSITTWFVLQKKKLFLHVWKH